MAGLIFIREGREGEGVSDINVKLKVIPDVEQALVMTRDGVVVGDTSYEAEFLGAYTQFLARFGDQLGLAEQVAGGRQPPVVLDHRRDLPELARQLDAAVLVVVHWAQPTGEAVDQGMYYQDTTWYHMSFSARFAQTGDIGPLHFTDPLKLTAWFYPQNSELPPGEIGRAHV